MSEAAPILASQPSLRCGVVLLVEPGAVHEVRILHTPRGTVSGYFDSLDKLAEAVAPWDGKAPAIYVTLNPVKPDLLARAHNRLREHARETTADQDILRRRWFALDFDPLRPSGISSNEAEHEAALARAREVQDWLAGGDWPDGVLVDSGNGAHLLFRVELENTAEALQLITRCLEALAFQFSDETVALDLKVGNAARIWKLPGTMACKGDSLPERPHRRSRILEAPASLTCVPVDLLEALAGSTSSIEDNGHRPGGAGQAFDLDGWLASHPLPIVSSGSWNGGRKWILNPCPWNPDHTNRAAFILQFPSGAVAAGCHHNGCHGKDWHALRDLVEPGWRVARECARDEPASALIVPLSAVAPERVSWVWHRRIPRGKLVLVVGDPGLGKTFVCLDVSARVTVAASWPDGGRAEWGNVVLLTAEDGLADTVRPRVDAMGGDPACIHVLKAIRDKHGERGFDLSSDLPHLEAAIRQTQAVLAVIDPVSAYLGKTDSWRDAEVRGVLAPVAALAERTGAAIVGTMHLTKNDQRRVIHRVQGTIAFAAAARAVYAVAQDRDDPELRLFLPVKLNIARKPPGLAFRLVEAGSVARLVWEAEPVTVDADTALASPERPEERGERETAAEFLREVLAAGPVPATAVKTQATQAGIAQRTLWRAKGQLGVKASKSGFGGGWLWELPNRARPL